MNKESLSAQCDLSSENANVSISDRRNFGPQRYYSREVTIFCKRDTCTLSEGIRVSYPTVVAGTHAEIERIVRNEILNSASQLNTILRQIRSNDCPIFRDKPVSSD